MGIGLYSTDLAKNLSINGHSVIVLTTIPYYPWWKTPFELESYCKKETLFEGVKVLRVNLKIPSQPKTLARISFEIRMWLKMKKMVKSLDLKSIDLVISIVPSLGPGLVGAHLSKRYSKRHYVIVQDLTSKGVKESGMSFGSFLEVMVSRLECRVIKSANKAAVIAKPMKGVIQKWISGDTQIEFIPNYSINEEDSGNSPARSREELQLPEDKFLVIYTGSIAKKQNLINLCDAARMLQEVPSIHILVFGHGNAETELKNAAKGLTNFSVRPAISDSNYLDTLIQADLLVVNERSTQTTMALPSKIISYFASGTPVIAAIPSDGASYKLLQNRAFVIQADDPNALAEEIKKAMESPSEGDKFARNALNFYTSNLTKHSGRVKYLDWVTN